MKLTFLFIVVSFFQLQAFTFYGQNAKVSFNMDDASLEMVIKSIEGQTDYKFFYNIEDIDTRRPFTLKVDKRPLRAVLKTLFKNSSIDYVVVDKQIVLTIKKEETSIRVPTETIQHRVKGTVTDSNGVPITGATVTIKGTSTGTFTNEEGVFFVNASPPDVLVLTYIGFKPLELQVGNSDELSIVLQEDITNLDAVTVNAGYYTVKERERTGSIAKVTAEELELQPIVSPMEALQGRMVGVEIDQLSGMPGAAPRIRIRGTNSLRTEGNYPLYIIDGVPISSEPLSDYTLAGGVQANLLQTGLGIDPLSTLNLADIKSIEVLKDADATAIYGSRGANGVVLITMKGASAYSQKTQLQAQWYSGIGQVERKENLLNSEQYVAFRKAYLNNSGYNENNPMYPNYAQDLLNWDNSRYTDWQNELIGGIAEFSNLNLSLTGGSDNTTFRLSGGFSNQGTVFPIDIGYKKLSVGVKINHTSDNKKWNLQFSGNYGADETQSTPTADMMNTIYLPPIAPKLYNEDGSLHWEEWEKIGNSNIYNPLRSKYAMTNGNINSLISNITISYNILKVLTLKTSIGYTENRREAVSKQSLLFYAPSIRGIGNYLAKTSIEHAKRTSWIVEPQISYNTNLFHGKLDILIGSTFQSNENTSTTAYGRGFVDESLSGDLGAADFRLSLGGRIEEYRYQAIFGRIGYNWRQKYYLNFTGRRDGSSRFGPGKRFSNFGAVGAAWIFTEESLLKNKASWFSFGKLRGSYGVTGSDQIGDYQYIDSYRSTTAPGGLYPTQLYNDNFAWEKNKKLEAALELGFLNDRIHLGLSWYRNRSSNQLVGYTLPSMTGFSSVLSNLPATVQNTGWEAELSLTPFKNKNFRWDAYFNLSFPKNKLLEFPDIELTPYVNQYRVGHPLNIALLFDYIGKNKAGQFQFTDFDKNGIHDISDRIVVQNRSRKYFGGLRNSLSYKQWKLDVQLDFVKRQVGRPSSLFYSFPASTTRNYAHEQYKMWEDGELNPDNSDSSQYRYYLQSSYNTVDGSYLRVKNVSLVYSMPESWIQPIGISRWNVFFTAQNLATITSYPGINVESAGVPTLPPLRMFSTGLQLTF